MTPQENSEIRQFLGHLAAERSTKIEEWIRENPRPENAKAQDV